MPVVSSVNPAQPPEQSVVSTSDALNALAKHCLGLFALAFEGVLVEIADLQERLAALEAARG